MPRGKIKLLTLHDRSIRRNTAADLSQIHSKGMIDSRAVKLSLSIAEEHQSRERLY
jgi:hypothetical protein